jgi:uncharacterized protein YggE
MKKRISSIAALSLVLAALVAPATEAAATRYITVKAQGTVQVTPDAVRISASANNVAASSKEALAATAKSSAAIRAALKSSKIDSKDIATQSVSVFPEYKYSNDGGSTLVGYRATQSFTITVRAANTAGAVVDAIVAAAGDSAQISGVSPFVLDSAKSSEAARAVAVKNAKARALSYAKLLGVKLGKINYLVEESAPNSLPPVFATAKAEDAATVVDLGQQDVTVSITAQWALL